MGTLMNSLFGLMLSWARGLMQEFWSIAEGNHSSLLEFLAEHWLFLALCILIAGLALDWIVWAVRWRPYHLLALRVRRALGLEDKTGRRAAAREEKAKEAEALREAWLPMEPPEARGEDIPDEALGAYPGMRYVERPQETRRMDALPAQGVRRDPAPAEDAYRRELERYEREKAQYERDLAEYERQKAAYEAGQAAEGGAEARPARRRRRGGE